VSTTKINDKWMVPVIGTVSVLIPIVVSILLFADLGDASVLGDVTFLPTLNAILNSTVSVLLLLALVFIKRKMVNLHKVMTTSAFVLSAVFLISYVIYHYAHGGVKYGGEGAMKAVYLFILFSHILLSVAVVPLAMMAILRGVQGKWPEHRKIVKFAWPIWFYVSVTGVVVYLFAHVFNPAL
jgi:putative membrane protein